MTDPIFVAEIKTKNPFDPRYQVTKTSELVAAADEHADMLSVHTSGYWGGSFSWLRLMCQSTNKPVLAKGAHMFGFEVEDALACGATYVLTMNATIALAYPDVCWYEGHHAHWGVGNTRPSPQPWVRNTRSLVDGAEILYAKGEIAHCTELGYRIVQASNIHSPADVWPGVYAYIVGTHLREFIDARTNA